MSALIEGWFHIFNGRPFDEVVQDSNPSSPRKIRPLLTLHDCCTTIGVLCKKVHLESDLRLYSQIRDLHQRLIYARGRFSLTPTDEGAAFVQIDAYRITILDLDPEDSPDDIRTSVTLYGRVVPINDVVENTPDRFFMLEVSDYVRDHTQTFTIRFAFLYNPPDLF